MMVLMRVTGNFVWHEAVVDWLTGEEEEDGECAPTAYIYFSSYIGQ